VLLELGIATMIVTPGEAVRKEAIEAIPLAPGPGGGGTGSGGAVVETSGAATSGAATRRDRRRHYFLFVGTLEPRKNLLSAGGGVARSAAAAPDRSGAGRAAARGWAGFGRGAGAAARRAKFRTRNCPDCTRARWPLFTRRSTKAFGLPVLEAMQCGAGVIASRAVAEAAGDAAVYADGVEELARAMRDAAERPEWRAERRALSLERARGVFLGAHRPADTRGVRGGQEAFWPLKRGPRRWFWPLKRPTRWRAEERCGRHRCCTIWRSAA
jgi:hypothetical protein